MAERRPIRCAIYTRKSTEEGLEQAFNSLDAQREACAAYILSQQHEGWKQLTELYDDGGFSGGTMDRPGLRHLLADVEAGKVDVIVVYKVVRLTRSLADFARIVDILDRKGASFVSVTQSFNTTTSMGRLTLNVLLSFAQFEREVTGERIRDKIAASKARGMWMGGVVPLGYAVEDRRLVVVPDDAATVRMIFERYCALGSVLALADELEAQGIHSRARTSRNGRCYGGKPFSRGALYLMLQNRIYLGEIVHKGKSYPGQHDPIIDPTLFEAAGSLLERNRVDRTEGTNADMPSLLAGKVMDGEGRRLTPSHAVKKGKRYRYYVCAAEVGGQRLRVPAGDLEAIVWGQLERLIAPNGASLHESQRILVDRHVEQVLVHPDRIDIGFREIPDETSRAISIPTRLGRRGKETRIAVPPAERGRTERDPSLIKLVVKAHMAREAVMHAGAKSIAEIAAAQGYTRDYFGVLLRIAYLAPDIVTAILDGHQPTHLNRQKLARMTSLPRDWQGQREMLGFC